MPPPPERLEIKFPRKGLHRGETFAEQPALTTPAALNVRGYDGRDRSGGGKRDGMRKAVGQQAGTSATSNRITCLEVLSRARGAPGQSLGTLLRTTDDFSGYSVASPADIGDNYKVLQWNQTVSYAFLEVYGFTGANEGFVTTAPTALGSRLTMSHEFTTAAGVGIAAGAQINFHSDNDVTLSVEANHTNAFLTHRWGGAGEAWGVGPFCLAATDFSRFIVARLIQTAAGTFRLQLFDYAGTGSSTQLALSGSDFVINAAGSPSVFTIRIRATSAGNVEATLNWPAQAISNHTITATIPGALANNTAAGWCMCTTSLGGAGGAVGSVLAYRVIRQVEYGKFIPQSYQVHATAAGVNPNPADGNRYYVPSGFRAVGRNAGVAAPQVVDGVFTVNALPRYPVIDDVDNFVESGTDTYGALVDLNPPTDGSRRGIDMVVKPNVVNTAAGSQPTFGCAFRVSDDSTAMVYLRFACGSSATTGATGVNVVHEVLERQILNGVASPALNTIFPNPAAGVGLFVFREASRLRFTDDGTTIRLYVNGVLIFSHVPGAWAAPIAANVRAGIALPLTGVLQSAMNDCRIVQGELTTAVDVGETEPLVLVCTPGQIEIADLYAGTLSATTGGLSFSGGLPEATSLSNVFYALDGTQTGGLIINPLTLVVSDWVGSPGTAPWDDASLGGMRLVTTYRFRVVVARAAGDPSFWAMTRMGAPQDFEYGSTNDPATKAYAGTVAGLTTETGKPGDVITALVAFSDDFLIFGGARSIAVLEGDPGYKGAVQPVTERTGIVGPRAWDMDERGNLIFIGSGGLYRMPRGSLDYEPLSGRRLAQRLDRVNLSTTLVQLVLDNFRRHAHIFLTPTDGATLGTHVIYDLDEGGFWEDQYPLDFGPWSCAGLAGIEDTDRRFIIGGDAGYIQRPDSLVFSDDGDAIDSWVEIGPLSLGAGAVESIAIELQATIASSTTSTLTWYWFVGESADEVAAQTFGDEVTSGTWGGSSGVGWQDPTGLRERGGWHKLRIRANDATGTWALEQVAAMLQARSGRR